MSEIRARRQKLVREIIRSANVGNHEELVARLAEHGVAVGQATVSRDLDQLGAVKVKRGGALCYSLPEQLADNDWAAARLKQILAEWVQSVEPSGQLLVLKTPPGSAHVVGLAMDQAKLPDIVGTIAGDDTIFIAVRDGVAAADVADRLRAMIEE